LTQELEFLNDDKIDSSSINLIWTRGMHAAVLGAEAGDADTESSLQIDTTFNGETTSELSEGNPGLNKWAVYINDTITLDKLTITPGVRYDYNNITGEFTSPSLGITYKLADRTILRASAARGFTIPPLNNTSVGGANFEPNPDLKPESVWSYQAGMESGVTDYIWLKAVLFRHEMKDGIVDARTGDEAVSTKDNEDKIHRTGIEAEAETAPFYNTSVKAGFAYTDLDPVPDEITNGNYSYNMAIKYDDKESLMAQLSGRYVWWYFGHAILSAKYDDSIWDFNLRKTLHSTDRARTEVFFAAHNIFNGSYYTLDVYKNPSRWVEAGAKLIF
jgi:vitamin B12 transporter